LAKHLIVGELKYMALPLLLITMLVIVKTLHLFV